MSAQDRRQQLLEWMRRHPYSLPGLFRVTPLELSSNIFTLRRDLTELERVGALRRTPSRRYEVVAA